MSEAHDGRVLTLPVRKVFALQIREQDNTLLVRLVGFHDDDEVPEAHVPPLPEIVEVTSAPYRRLLSDTQNIH